MSSSSFGYRRVLCVVGLCLLSLLSPATFSSIASAGEETAPIVLWRSLLTPPKIAETGLAPEVQVRATIDERGNVSMVEVLSVRPSTDHDDVVIEATKELIGSWRYAPALDANGNAKSATLQWTMNYSDTADGESLRGATTGIAPALTSALSTPDIDVEFRLATVAQQAEVLEGLAATAQRFLDQSKLKRAASNRFIVTTDADEEAVASVIAGNLEATFNFLDGLFGRELELLPDRHKFMVYFYAEQADFLKLSSSLSRIGGNYFGFYRHPGLFAFHQEMPSQQALVRALLHEATHGYLFRYLLRPGARPNYWFVEGLAEYVGNSTVNRKGEIEIGRAISGRYILDYHGGARRQRTTTGWTLEQTKDAIRKGEAPTLGELLLTPGALFTGERGPLNYGMSWLFVHFLRHGDVDARGSKGKDGEWAESKFPAFLLYLVEGYSEREALETVYEMSLAEMDQLFREYARRF